MIVAIGADGRGRMKPKGWRKHSKEALEGIKQALIETRDIDVVANKLGTSPKYLISLIQRNHWRLNLKRRPTPKRGFGKQTIEKAHRMAAVRSKGATLEEIGNKFKVTRERARQLLNAIGVETCRRGKVDVCNAIKMIEGGMIIRDVATHFGVSETTLRNIIKSEWIGHLEMPPKQKRPYVSRRNWDIDAMYELYLKKTTYKELGKKVGLTEAAMCNALSRHRKRFGLEKRK